jgi:hypothetical protein
MAIVPKVLYKFNAIPIRIPLIPFIVIENNPKLHMEAQKAKLH